MVTYINMHLDNISIFSVESSVRLVIFNLHLVINPVYFFSFQDFKKFDIVYIFFYKQFVFFKKYFFLFQPFPSPFPLFMTNFLHSSPYANFWEVLSLNPPSPLDKEENETMRCC